MARVLPRRSLGLVLTLALVCLLVATGAAGPLTVGALDVGGGDSVLVQFPDGLEVVVGGQSMARWHGVMQSAHDHPAIP